MNRSERAVTIVSVLNTNGEVAYVHHFGRFDQTEMEAKVLGLVKAGNHVRVVHLDSIQGEA